MIHILKFIGEREGGVSWVCGCGVAGLAKDRTGAKNQWWAHMEEFIK